MENISVWKAHTVQFGANTVLLALCTKIKKGFLLKMSENEFLWRHNTTASYITNRVHLQKSSPRREKMDLALRELNSATENALLDVHKNIFSQISEETFGVHKRIQ